MNSTIAIEGISNLSFDILERKVATLLLPSSEGGKACAIRNLVSSINATPSFPPPIA
jgi:hypothetical protein